MWWTKQASNAFERVEIGSSKLEELVVKENRLFDSVIKHLFKIRPDYIKEMPINDSTELKANRIKLESLKDYTEPEECLLIGEHSEWKQNSRAG